MQAVITVSQMSSLFPVNGWHYLF